MTNNKYKIKISNEMYFSNTSTEKSQAITRRQYPKNKIKRYSEGKKAKLYLK